MGGDTDRQGTIETALEHEKLQLERDKLKLERFKVWFSWIPVLAIVAPIAYGIWEHGQNARAEFELKAAEIVLTASSPHAAANKAFALKRIFPNRLSEDFAESFDPNALPHSAPAPGVSPKPAPSNPARGKKNNRAPG
jgi:hypothetical protein